MDSSDDEYFDAQQTQPWMPSTQSIWDQSQRASFTQQRPTFREASEAEFFSEPNPYRPSQSTRQPSGLWNQSSRTSFTPRIPTPRKASAAKYFSEPNPYITRQSHPETLPNLYVEEYSESNILPSDREASQLSSARTCGSLSSQRSKHQKYHSPEKRQRRQDSVRGFNEAYGTVPDEELEARRQNAKVRFSDTPHVHRYSYSGSIDQLVPQERSTEAISMEELSEALPSNQGFKLPPRLAARREQKPLAKQVKRLPSYRENKTLRMRREMSSTQTDTDQSSPVSSSQEIVPHQASPPKAAPPQSQETALQRERQTQRLPTASRNIQMPQVQYRENKTLRLRQQKSKKT